MRVDAASDPRRQEHRRSEHGNDHDVIDVLTTDRRGATELIEQMSKEREALMKQREAADAT